MTVLEQKKFRLIRAIMNDTDEKRVSEIEKVYKRLTKQEENPSFMCSLEELRASLPEIEKEFAEGKYIPHEEMKRKHVS